MNKLKDTARLAKALIFLVIGVITFPLSIVLFVGYFIACFILKFSYVTLPLIFFIVAWRHNYPDVSFFKSLPMTIDIFKKFDKADINTGNVKVTDAEIEEAYKEVDPHLVEVIRKALVNIRDFHEFCF